LDFVRDETTHLRFIHAGIVNRRKKKGAPDSTPARLIKMQSVGDGIAAYLPLRTPMSTGGGGVEVLEAQEERLRAAMARTRAERTTFMVDSVGFVDFNDGVCFFQMLRWL
jgi:hypothetical protein